MTYGIPVHILKIVLPYIIEPTSCGEKINNWIPLFKKQQVGKL
jgi:hypothetical protein